jgi:glycosyltransferase involved in cell wall biosynthesis
MRIAIVIPHMFMHRDVIDSVIFAPGRLGADLASGLISLGHEVTLFSPGYDLVGAKNVHPDLSLFEEELKQRGDTYPDLLKKHPLIFISMARHVQAELIAEAYSRANAGDFDIVHVYTNEEETALVFAKFCQKPLVFTHHEPFNFLTKYRSSFPKYKHLPWISISQSQQKGMPSDTNFVGTIYHGIDTNRFKSHDIKENYFAYFGRIIEPKGVHLAIAAAKKAGVSLKIAGKHYAGFGKDTYWEEIIEPQIDGVQVEYIGFIDNDKEKEQFLGNARALLVPSLWEEPFGMVMIEALGCGTPVIGLASGSIPEIIDQGVTGYVIPYKKFLDNENKERINEEEVVDAIVEAMTNLNIPANICRNNFEQRFTLERMCKDHEQLYNRLLQGKES